MRTRTPVKRGEMEAITVILCLGGFPNDQNLSVIIWIMAYRNGKSFLGVYVMVFRYNPAEKTVQAIWKKTSPTIH